MKLKPAEIESLLGLLGHIYDELHAIETEYRLMAGDSDFRPRIEYFHDAIRAFTSYSLGPQASDRRLSIELLAYDIAGLRYIAGSPLSPFKPQASKSPSTQVLAPSTGRDLASRPRRPDRAVRERISELYQHYAVLFAALLKPVADSDCETRLYDLNQDVTDIKTLAGLLEKLGQGKATVQQVADAAAHLEEEELRLIAGQFMQGQKYKKKEDRQRMVQFLKERAAAKDKAIAAIDKAHTHYAMAQLGVFEASKDMLKKMAGQGMNLVGRFVEAAAAETRRQMGR